MIFSKIRLKWLFLLVIALVIVVHPYFQIGVPDTHDGNNHLVRFASYKIALKEGQFPPRWAPNLLNLYGYPVFNFNYPLSNIISLPFSILKIPYELTFKVLVILYILVGIVSLRSWLKLLQFKTESICIAVATWLFFPFLISTIYFRGNIGEIAAYGLMPSVFYIIEYIHSKKIFAVRTAVFSLLFATFMLSHNITVVFFVPIFILYSVMRFGKNLRKWRDFLTVIFLSICLSLWFWLPALVEMNLTNVNSTGLTKEFTTHFPTISQLLFSPLTFGYSYLGMIDGLSFSIGAVAFVSIVSSILLLVVKVLTKRWSSTDGLFTGCVIAAVLLFFFQTEFSSIFWNFIPMSGLIQFPWRLSIYLGLIVSYLTAYLWGENKLFKLLIFVSVLVAIRNTVVATPIRIQHQERSLYDTQTISTSILAENKPSTFTYEMNESWEPAPKILQGQASVTPISWNGSRRSYLLDVKTTTQVVEPTARFAGWETQVTQGNSTKKVDYVDDEVIRGRIGYILEPGVYQVQTTFTQNTWPRLLGNVISIISFLYIVKLLLLRKHHE